MSADSVRKIVFAAGCFWGTESIFRGARGVLETGVGYMGGHFRNPTYEDVLSDRTGHAEVAMVVYDSSVIDFETLLRMFFKSHNPTILPGEKSKYRTALFVYEEEQQLEAERYITGLKESGRYTGVIRTRVERASHFYPAEERHQHYHEKHKDVRGVRNQG